MNIDIIWFMLWFYIEVFVAIVYIYIILELFYLKQSYTNNYILWLQWNLINQRFRKECQFSIPAESLHLIESLHLPENVSDLVNYSCP